MGEPIVVAVGRWRRWATGPPDDIDESILEACRRDPHFARAFRRAEATLFWRGFRRGFWRGLLVDVAAAAIVLVLVYG